MPHFGGMPQVSTMPPVLGVILWDKTFMQECKTKAGCRATLSGKCVCLSGCFIAELVSGQPGLIG